MASIKKFSEQVIDLGERIGNVADAAQGKDVRRGPRARWLVLPAAGAGLYALTTSGAFARRASDAVKEVRVRASDLPDELMSRVHDATSSSATVAGRPAAARRAEVGTGVAAPRPRLLADREARVVRKRRTG